MPRFRIALAAAPVLLLIACTHDQPKAVVPEVATVATPIPAPVAATPPPDTSFKVSEAVRVKCNLPDTPTDSPQFDFDQTALRPRGMGILDGIAACMQKGSMKGEGVIVTGHTDPRGSDSYNEDLEAIPATQIQDTGAKLVMPGATKAALKSMPQFDYADDTTNRDQFVANADRDIGKAKAKVGELDKSAAVATSDAKVKLDQQAVALHKDLKVADEKLGEMKRATAKRWKEFEAAVSAATARLRSDI